MERIAIDNFFAYCEDWNTYRKARVSTVKLGENKFETLVMYDSTGGAIEEIRTNDIEAAKAAHNRMIEKYIA